MTALKKLLNHPHKAVFDVAPAEQLAFRILGPDGVSWSIADRVLTVSIAGVERDYDLSAFTISQLAQQLVADGLSVDAVSAEFADLAALVLVESEGSQTSSGLMFAFTNLNWALFGAYAKELAVAGQQVVQAIRQMVIGQSETEWLDLHGALYDQKRRPNQTDADYAQTIPREAFRVRVNALAIEKAIFEATGKDVTIEEPWELLFRLSESKLSGSERFYDGNLVGPCLIQPVAKKPIDWSDVIPIISRNKAAGVIMLSPVSRPSSFVSGGLVGKILSSTKQIRGAFVTTQGEGRLDFMSLSNEMRPPRNYRVATALVLGVSSLANNSPASVTMKTYQFSGATWLYAKEWGAFAWNSDISNDDVSLGVSANITVNEIEIWE